MTLVSTEGAVRRPDPAAGRARRWLPGWRTRHPLGVVCACYLVLLVAAVVAAPLLSPYPPATQDLANTLSGPSAAHWLGTDQLGRDVASRLLYGGRGALTDVLIAVLTMLVVGVPFGLLAGYLGGWVDKLVMRVADLIFAVPGIIVLLLVVAIFPGNDVIAMITLGIIHSAGLIRIIRGSTIACRDDLFVRAAVLSGLRTPLILRRHLLPSLAGPIIVQGSLFAASALVIESGLSFLGLLRPDTSGPSWGNLVTQAANVSGQDGWLLVPTGGIVALTVVAFSLLGDSVRDATVGRSMPAVTLRTTRRVGTPAPPAAAPVPGALLEVTGLTVAVGRAGAERTLLSDVSFTVAAGECVGIVGESGCGKSTTAAAILGLLPGGGRVTGGSVRFDGVELTDLPEHELAKVRGAGVALVGQDPLNSLDPVYPVGSQLREVIRRHNPGLNRKGADERALELLRMVRFPDPAAVLPRRPHELSGGMAQRVGIALALAAEPKLLIADEPTSALDVTVQAEILALLRDLRERLGMAVILITHDWGVVADACDRTLVMYSGEIVEQGTVEQVYEGPAHPYSAALLASSPQLVTAGDPLPTIPGAVPEPGRWPTGCRFEPRCGFAATKCARQRVELHIVRDGRASRCVRVDEFLERR
jgi:peptide/nickel transport system permease protein